MVLVKIYEPLLCFITLANASRAMSESFNRSAGVGEDDSEFTALVPIPPPLVTPIDCCATPAAVIDIREYRY